MEMKTKTPSCLSCGSATEPRAGVAAADCQRCSWGLTCSSSPTRNHFSHFLFSFLKPQGGSEWREKAPARQCPSAEVAMLTFDDKLSFSCDCPCRHRPWCCLWFHCSLHPVSSGKSHHQGNSGIQRPIVCECGGCCEWSL